MSPGPWKSYRSVPFLMGNGTIDFQRHTFTVHLFGPGSNAGDLSKGTRADLTDEVSDPREIPHSWEQDDAGAVFGGSRVTWAVEDESLEARYAAVIRRGTVNGVTDALVAVCQLDSQAVRVTPGNELRLRISEMGIIAYGVAA